MFLLYYVSDKTKFLSFCIECQQTELPLYCVITHLSSNRRHGCPPPSCLYRRVWTPRCRYCSLLRHVVRSSHPRLPIIVASQHQRTSNRLYARCRVAANIAVYCQHYSHCYVVTSSVPLCHSTTLLCIIGLSIGLTLDSAVPRRNLGKKVLLNCHCL